MISACVGMPLLALKVSARPECGEEEEKTRTSSGLAPSAAGTVGAGLVLHRLACAEALGIFQKMHLRLDAGLAILIEGYIKKCKIFISFA